MKEYKYKINGNSYTVAVGDIDNDVAQVEVNGVPYNVEIQTQKKATVAVKAVKTAPAPAQKTVAKPVVATAGNAVKSPLPGVVVEIKVAVGDTVTADTVVAVLEAMKMENNINAGTAGVVKSINVNKGDSVLEGTDILVIA